MNWYAYVGNDPVNATDPSGLRSSILCDEEGAICQSQDVGSDDSSGSNKQKKGVVTVVKPYKRPILLGTPPPPATMTPEEAKKARAASPFKKGKVGKDAKELIKKIIATDEFQGEATTIYNDSVNANPTRELGALAVYENEAGGYDVYSIGIPNPSKANSMNLDFPDNPSDTLLFFWHPHPFKGGKQPSYTDLRTSPIRGVPGVIRYGSNKKRRTIFIGERK